MKKLLLSGVALIGISAATSVFAADLPRRYVPPPVVEPAFSWTGFYVGLNAGYGWNNMDDPTWRPYSGYNYGYNYGHHGLSINNDGGFVGGAQIGYNYEMGQGAFGRFVVGLEADIQYADIGGQASWNNSWDAYYWNNASAYNYYGAKAGSDLTWFGTVRARAGVAFDRALIYVTGGLAYGGGDNDKFCNQLVAAGGWGKCNDSTGIGWAVGGGLEYAFTNNWTAKIEGLYVNIDRSSSNVYVYNVVNPANDYYYKTKSNNEFAVFRVGLNYKFSSY